MVDDASVPIQVIITIVSFILSSLFASSEYALNILNESELKKFDSKRENKKYEKLYKVVENDTDYVEAMHLGRLLFLLLSAVCMFSVIAGRIVSLETVFKVLIIAAFIVLFTMLTAAFVYLIPHHVVLHDPVKRGMGLIGFICFFKVVFYPFVKLNYLIVKAILSVFRTHLALLVWLHIDRVESLGNHEYRESPGFRTRGMEDQTFRRNASEAGSR